MWRGSNMKSRTYTQHVVFVNVQGLPRPWEPEHSVSFILVASKHLHILRLIQRWGPVALSISVLEEDPTFSITQYRSTDIYSPDQYGFSWYVTYALRMKRLSVIHCHWGKSKYIMTYMKEDFAGIIHPTQHNVSAFHATVWGEAQTRVPLCGHLLKRNLILYLGKLL